MNTCMILIYTAALHAMREADNCALYVDAQAYEHFLTGIGEHEDKNIHTLSDSKSRQARSHADSCIESYASSAGVHGLPGHGGLQ